MKKTLYRVALSLVPGIGPVKYRNIIERLGEPYIFWDKKQSELIQLLKNTSEGDLSVYLKEANDQLKRARATGVDIITNLDPDYPKALLPFEYSPPLLFKKGYLKQFPEKAISIVGSRKATPYGRLQAKRFARFFAENGFTVVSGGARGIDSEAHRGALEVSSSTIVVLGSGLDFPYPRENIPLFQEIIKTGAIITEFPFGTPPLKENFPRRNRIISALSIATVVIEAGEKSGALITASWAVEQGKEVFALPGNVTSQCSRGTNMLIKEGARLVSSPEEVLEELGFKIEKKDTIERKKKSKEIEEILKVLTDEPLHIDDIAVSLGRPSYMVLSQLLEMELEGYVRQLPGKLFVKSIEDEK